MAGGYYSPPRVAARAVRGLLYPRRCPFCGSVLGTVAECAACASELENLRRRPSMRLGTKQHYLGMLSGAAAPFVYGGCVRRGILRAKYQGAPWVAAELGVYMARLLFAAEIEMRFLQPIPLPAEGFGLGYDCVVPVPASGRLRGYNVPELMAQPVAKALGLPVESRALFRARSGKHQAGLPFEERLANVAGAFAVRDIDAVDGRRVLLVDDVITTGATAAACTQALLDAGAQSVFAVSLATVEFGKRPAAEEPVFENGEDEEAY